MAKKDVWWIWKIKIKALKSTLLSWDRVISLFFVVTKIDMIDLHKCNGRHFYHQVKSK